MAAGAEPPAVPEDEPTAVEPPADAADERPPVEPLIVPGRPSLENALFVLLGVAVALAVVFRLVELFG